MPGFHITQDDGAPRQPYARSHIDPMRTYRWRLDRLEWDDESPVDFMSKDQLRSFVSMDLPSTAIKEISVSGLSLKYKFASSVDFPDINITFYDMFTSTYIERWMDKIWNPYVGLSAGYGTNYKGRLFMSELDHEGNPSNEFLLYNAWPKSIKNDTLNMESSNIKKVTVTFSYDWYVTGPINAIDTVNTMQAIVDTVSDVQQRVKNFNKRVTDIATNIGNSLGF